MNLLGDLRHALRQIRRAPGFALVVILTLGSAMGVSTAFFSFINAGLFSPWDVPNADEIVTTMWVSQAEAEAFRREATTARAIAISVPQSGRLQDRSRVRYAKVTPNYFSTLGVAIARGHGFGEHSATLGSPDAEAVISHRTWETRFALDPDVVGRVLHVEGKPVRVVGVAAAGFEGGDFGLIREHFWLPLAPPESLLWDPSKGGPFARVIVRLRPDIPSTTVEAELNQVRRRVRGQWPRTDDVPLTATDFYSQFGMDPKTLAQMISLVAAMAFLTLIAAANVSNLLLARGHARRSELAVRLALGAGRARIVRQMVMEVWILCLLAGGFGLAVSTVIPRHVFETTPEFMNLVRLDFSLDARMYAWAFGFSTMACLVLGVTPALRSASVDINQVLKNANGGVARSLRGSLTMMQTLISVFALGVAALVLRSDTHLSARSVIAAVSDFTVARLEQDSTAPTSASVGARKRAVEEILDAYGAARVVLSSQSASGAAWAASGSLRVSANYFASVGMTLVAGRAFQTSDPVDAVAVVNETLALKMWGGENPIGRMLPAAGPSELPREVVGVVRDPTTSFAVAYAPARIEDAHLLLIRDSESDVRTLATRVDRFEGDDLRIEVLAGESWARISQPLTAFSARILGEFGLFALALAAMGLFTLADYSVRQRTREIGVRSALGARTWHVLAAVLAPTVRSLAEGVVLGFVLVAIAAFLMKKWQIPEGIHPLDPATSIGVVGLVVAAAVVAAIRPALRAVRVEPVEALRCE